MFHTPRKSNTLRSRRGNEADGSRVAGVRLLTSAATRGSILVALLWCVVLLAMIVVGVLHTSRMDLRVVKNHGDLIQAHYLALAGIEKAKAILYQDARDRRTRGQNHTGSLLDAPEHFRDVVFGRGQFRVFHQTGQEHGGSTLYGVTDEESRLNVNTVSAEELAKIENLTPQIAASIVDYRDQDQTVTPGGAESETYMGLQPPRLPRDGPFQTIRELLMVHGMSREFFLGEDVNQNGVLDPEENDGESSAPPDNRDGLLDAGWAGLMTVHSSARNVNASGTARVNVQSADESALAQIEGLSQDLAKAIVEYRGQNQLQSIVDLLDVARVRRQNQPSGGSGGSGSRNSGGGRNPQNPQGNQQGGTTTGEKLIDEDLFLSIADSVTIQSEQEQPGAININTASAPVLACLPGLTKELAQAIVSYRQSAGYFENIAWLLKVPGITRDILKQVAPRVCARSDTFRILSEGKITSTGARKRLEMIVRIGSSSVDTLSYREDL